MYLFKCCKCKRTISLNYKGAKKHLRLFCRKCKGLHRFDIQPENQGGVMTLAKVKFLKLDHLTIEFQKRLFVPLFSSKWSIEECKFLEQWGVKGKFYKTPWFQIMIQYKLLKGCNEN